MKDLEIKTNIPLSKFTSWNIGGPAEWISEPKSIEEVNFLLSWAKKQNIKCNILGAGSNLLISDKGLPGLSICMRQLRGLQLDPQTGIIQALSGEPLPSLARRAASEGLHGLEWAVGIPGTVGGGVTMNAGASGKSISESVESVQVVSLSEGREFELKTKDLNFNYRHSLLQEKDLIVLSTKFKLEIGHNKRDLNKITSNHLNHRIKSQPYKEHSCGSVFRNPEPLKAGKLIEGLGLKGLRIGGAEVSNIHANFIINSNNASSDDVKKLIELIQKKVKSSYGILLHCEVKSYGF